MGGGGAGGPPGALVPKPVKSGGNGFGAARVAPVTVHFRVHVFGRFEDDAVLVGEERVAHAAREFQDQRQFPADAAADEALEFHRQHAVARDAFHVRHRAAAEMPLQPHRERRLHALAA